ncbi:MAG: WbqC family protein [Pontixanthobacter sp.]
MREAFGADRRRVAIMQPYLFPALPYLQLVHAADLFVLYDDAHFSHRRWTHRNRVQVNGAHHLFTVPLAERSQAKALCDIALHPTQFARWRDKFMRTMRLSYARAPFAGDIWDELEALLAGPHASLAELASASVRWLSDLFRIPAEYAVSSTIEFDRSLDAQAKILAMANGLGATHYVNMPGGWKLYDRPAFDAATIDLGFIENRLTAVDGIDLSALHLALLHPPERRAQFAAAYSIDGGAD